MVSKIKQPMDSRKKAVLKSLSQPEGDSLSKEGVRYKIKASILLCFEESIKFNA